MDEAPILDGDFKARLEHLLQEFNAYSEKALEYKEPDTLYEPIRYIMTLGGKRLRPLCALISYGAYKRDMTLVLPAAYSVEMFHNFSLVHDDIMDEALIRRGQPSVHHKYGMSTGILSGDVMLVQVFDHMLRQYKNVDALPLLRLFSSVAIEVCEGQQLDMDFESMTDVGLDTYLEMIRKKTAVLLGCSFEVGGLLAGCSVAELEQWQSFGENLGIAFQIRDDLLDLYGEAGNVGKIKGGDIRQGKKSVLYVQAMDRASSEEKKLISTRFSDASLSGDEKVEWFEGFFRDSGTLDAINRLVQLYNTRAKDALDALNLDEKNHAFASFFMTQLMNRKK